jgi:hypothetical protein
MSMTTERKTRASEQLAEWKAELRRRLVTPLSPEEITRRREATKRTLALRDRGPSIAPDTTGQYIDEIRREQEERA